MGSSPIARSIFLLILLISFSVPLTSSAQVTKDDSLPFGQGQVVLLPATTDYLGDLPHFIDLLPNDEPFHTIGGLQTPLVGWVDPMGQNSPGLHGSGPGVFFENIPYPLAASSLNLLPASGTMQILNFPAQAWLGNQAASGAINLTAPATLSSFNNRLSGWGSTGTTLGLDDRFQSGFLGADLDYRHGNSVGFSQIDQFNFISKENWLKTDNFNLGTGFLGTQGLANDHWYSSFIDLDLSSPNFQTLQFKPYVQSAQSGSQTAQDVGCFLNYLFNLAGLAESHLGVGLDTDNGTNLQASNTGFLQSTNLIDVLGNATMDAAFRWDFSSVSNTAFSTVLGAQGKLDAWTLLGDYDKAVLPLLQEDVQQADMGFRLQPDDSWALTTKYIYQQLGTIGYSGGDLLMQFNEFNGVWFVPNVRFDAEERVLVQTGGAVLYDTGLTCKLSFSSQDVLWVRGRSVSNQPVFLEAGLDYAFNNEVKVFGSFENMTGISMAIPDLDEPNGMIASIGVQYSAN